MVTLSCRQGNLVVPSWSNHAVFSVMASLFQTSAMAKELEAVHEEMEEREVQMAALTKALSEAGVGLRYHMSLDRCSSQGLELRNCFSAKVGLCGWGWS